MSILRSGKMPVACLVATAALLLVSMAFLSGRASAATYPGGNASTFATGDGGWTSQAQYGGLCVPGLTCPQLTGSFVPDGGAGGSSDGYISMDSGTTTLAALLSTSSLTWTSPAFTYNGVNGADAEKVDLSVAVNPGVSQLLNLGADVAVTARVVPAAGQGAGQIAIDNVSPGTTTGWRTLNGTLSANSLDPGKQYRIELVASIGGLAAVLPAGSIGFDDVSIIASRSGDNGGGGNGGGGNGGNGAALPPPAVIPPGKAFLYKNRLFIRLQCPRAFKPRCAIRAVALTKKRRGKALTPVRRANIRSGRVIRKVLGVKPKFRKRVRQMAKAKRRNLIVRVKIRSKRGKKHVQRFHKLRVIVRTRR